MGELSLLDNRIDAYCRDFYEALVKSMVSRQSAELHERFQTVRRMNEMIRRYDRKERLLDELGARLLDPSLFCGALIILQNQDQSVNTVRAVQFKENKTLIEKAFLQAYPTKCVELAREKQLIQFQSREDHTYSNCPVLPHLPPIAGSLNGRICYQDRHYGCVVAFLHEGTPPEAPRSLFEDALTDIGYAVGMWEHEKRLKRQNLPTEEANRNRLRFFSMLGHELRNPLNGIIGIVSMLNERELDEETRESIDIINISSQLLLDLLNDILEFNRLEIGEFRLRPEKTDLSLELELFQRIMRERARLKEIDLHLFNHLGPGERLLDWTRVRQVLLNLVGNALKFTPSRGSIEIHANAAGTNYICFSVVDNGVGIDLETHRDLFEPYRQAHGKASQQEGGLGLGLAICRMIVERCGGHIRVTSEPGRGATFSFSVEAPPVSPG